MQFSKIEALGNDFVVFGSPSQTSLPDKELLKLMCDRHYGVGADCAVYISQSTSADFAMHVFNPDGFEAEICGNALRCSAKYVTDNGYFRKRHLNAETNAGIRSLKVDGESITAEIGVPSVLKNGRLEVAGKSFNYIYVSIGNPHCVIFVNSMNDDEFNFYGPAIEGHPAFPNGTNVEFAKINDECDIEMRVWERGIGETLSCSTGSCACVAAAHSMNRCKSNVDIHQKGGKIRVCTRACGNMFITGTCKTVFKGTMNTNSKE